MRGMVTDKYLLKQLDKPDDWEFFKDYSVEYPTNKFYRNIKTNERMIVCQGLPKVNVYGEKICGNSPNETTVGWEETSIGYRGKPNVYSAAVVKGKVYFKRLDNQKRVDWSPQLFLNGVEKPCSPNPSLLDDPTNPNYHQNVLEWDYGICKRRLRIIEGGLFERWIFLKNPKGEVRIKHNQSGDLKLSFGQYQINDDEELIPAEVFNEAEYPFRVGADLTVYSTASDGYVACNPGVGVTWDTVQGNAVGDDVQKTTDDLVTAGNWTGTKFNCARSFLPWDASAAAGGTVTGVVVGLYGESLVETDATYADLGLVEGIQADPIVVATYGDHLTKTTLGHAAYHDVSASWNLGGYNDITLNATGIGWVQADIDASADVKLCARVRCDIADTQPSGFNRTDFWSNEKGAGFYPRLAITYTPAAGYTGGNVNGIVAASIASIDGVPTANISKVDGV